MRHVCVSKTLGFNVIVNGLDSGKLSGDPDRFVDLTLLSR